MTEEETNNILYMESLVRDFDKNMPAIIDFIRGQVIDKNLGTHYIYADALSPTTRTRRMLLFDIMLHESQNLGDDWVTAYYLLKEAYIMTDNIYSQLLNSPYQFDLKSYMREMSTHINTIDLMEDEEKSYLEFMTFPLTIYRGMCNTEYDSGDLGVSWTCDEETARNYVFYSKNNNNDKEGKLVNRQIERSDIFAVWGAVGKEKELIIIKDI